MQLFRDNRFRKKIFSLKIGQKGFTLGEVILSASILAIVFAGLSALNVGCIVLNEANRNLTFAMTHAQYVAEEIEDTLLNCNSSLDVYNNIEVEITNNGKWNWDSAEITAEGFTALTNENITTTVTTNGDPLGVNVKVAWQDRAQRQREINIDTLFTFK